MTEPLTGLFRTIEDVAVEATSDDVVQLLTVTPIPRGDAVRIEIDHADARDRGHVTVAGHVAESLPVMVNGRLRHRVVAETAERDGSTPTVATRSKRALLVREVPIRLLDLSLTGFLVESHQQIAAGITGTLRLRVQDSESHDTARVARSEWVSGTHRVFRMGGELFWTDRPGHHSVRNVVRTMAAPTFPWPGSPGVSTTPMPSEKEGTES